MPHFDAVIHPPPRLHTSLALTTTGRAASSAHVAELRRIVEAPLDAPRDEPLDGARAER
ncbi:hypothetical protein [Modestobacter excelsi]|uniref:hypothetical protein n=1 Tax=Modestobacter excelsi TaxID=2213161 RepID=UPI001FE686FB|nr:hypothetical protein [Modestobacter excelsi]